MFQIIYHKGLGKDTITAVEEHKKLGSIRIYLLKPKTFEN